MSAENSPPTGNEQDKPNTEDVRNLQDKFHNLLDQRNKFNDLGREARDARNLLNQQRREKNEEIEELKKLRNAANEKMREHRDLRNSYQAQAKALIEQKKGKKGAVERSLPLQVRQLKTQIQTAMERQETTVLGAAEEKDLIDDIRRKRAEMNQLESQMTEQKTLEVDLSDTDQAIDQLFGKADEEHEHVKVFHDAANEQHQKFLAAVKEIGILIEESNTKHQESLALRTKADEYHNKAMELREKVMAVRGEARVDAQRRRDEIRNVNTMARTRVNDPKAIEKANENALTALKKGGKISLGF